MLLLVAVINGYPSIAAAEITALEHAGMAIPIPGGWHDIEYQGDTRIIEGMGSEIKVLYSETQPIETIMAEINSALVKADWLPLPFHYRNIHATTSLIRGWSNFQDITNRRPRISDDQVQYYHPWLKKWLENWVSPEGDVLEYTVQNYYDTTIGLPGFHPLTGRPAGRCAVYNNGEIYSVGMNGPRMCIWVLLVKSDTYEADRKRLWPRYYRKDSDYFFKLYNMVKSWQIED